MAGIISHCIVSASLLAFFLAFPANAQVLSWQSAVAQTSKYNAEVQASAANVRALEFQETGSLSGYLPKVSAKLGYEYSEGSGSGASTTDKNYSATISASQNLFAGFGDLAARRKAESQVVLAQAGLTLTKAKVSYDLKTSFQGLVYAKESKKLTSDILRRRLDNLKLVEVRFEGGRENKGSVLLSKAYYKEAQYEELQSKNSYKVARSNLANVLGFDEFATYDIEGAVPLTNPPEVEPKFQDLVSRTPEYRQAFAQKQVADTAITSARSQFYPSLDLTGSIGKTGDSFFPDDENRKAVGISLTIPLFAGGKDYYATKSALASWSASSFALSTVTRAEVNILEKAYDDFLESVFKLDTDESFRAAALVRAEVARKKYNNGLISFEDWDVIENDLIAREKAYLVSERNRIEAEAAWEKAQGKGVLP
jgi:outer membrane protein